MRVALILLYVVSHLAVAQPFRGPEYELAELLGGRAQILQIHKELTSTVLAANPKFTPYQGVIETWSQQHITWEAIEAAMAAMYSQYFTDEEIQDMVDFYRGDTGRKATLLMPTLLREANLIGRDLAEVHKNDLIKLLREARSSSPAQ